MIGGAAQTRAKQRVFNMDNKTTFILALLLFICALLVSVNLQQDQKHQVAVLRLALEASQQENALQMAMIENMQKDGHELAELRRKMEETKVTPPKAAEYKKPRSKAGTPPAPSSTAEILQDDQAASMPVSESVMPSGAE
jgi:preprotein translocase subunit SecG